MRRLRHARESCPRCARLAFCDDCGLCLACGFAAPDVDLPSPPPPLPKARCPECNRASAHGRACSVTVRAAAN